MSWIGGKIMKKIYSSPEIEITRFSTEDIITTSSVNGGMTVGGTADLTGGTGSIDMDMNDAK